MTPPAGHNFAALTDEVRHGGDSPAGF